MENRIVLTEDGKKEPTTLTPQDIKQYICPLASDKEIFVFLNVCKMFNLNPFKREVYLVKYKADQPASTLLGYEVYLKRAERSGNWNGFEVTTKGTVSNGLKAVVKVWRKDWDHPLVHEAHYDEYVQYGKDFKTGEKYVNKFWKEKPRTMIKKVALSQAFRLAFPDELGGMPYTQDEINTIEVDEKLTTLRPEVQMPTLKETTKGQTDHPGKESDSQKTQPKTEKERFDVISQEQWETLVETAINNGWTDKEIAGYVKTLGYKAEKKHTKLSFVDFMDCEEVFSVRKEEDKEDV